MVRLTLPLRSAVTVSGRSESAADIAAGMKAVTSALADGAITPGEAAKIAAAVDTICPGDRRAWSVHNVMLLANAWRPELAPRTRPLPEAPPLLKRGCRANRPDENAP